MASETVGTPIVELIISSSFQRPGCVIEIVDRLRRQAYEQAGKRCRVCGGRGPQWPVEAGEAWDYEDATHTQTLKG